MEIYFGNIEKVDFIRIFLFLFLYKFRYQKHLFLVTSFTNHINLNVVLIQYKLSMLFL